MITKNKKPYLIYIPEIIYSNISAIRYKNLHVETKDAINQFIKTEKFNQLSSGKIHNDWFKKLKENDYIDLETGKKIPQETLKLLKIQRNITIKQLIKIPKLYETKDNTLINLSTRAYKFIWRMCESYELWCKETKQPKNLILNIIN